MGLHEPKPEWLLRPSGAHHGVAAVKRLLRRAKLNTVCEEARCPNIAECFSRHSATFMILGDICTRGCRFCSVKRGKPTLGETGMKQEAIALAEAAEQLGLQHIVITSVTRDDLIDGGASGFAFAIEAVRKRLCDVCVEVLIPDFAGDASALAVVASAGPDIINHNLETVPRLYPSVRPGAVYRRSLDLLASAKSKAINIKTKTGIMLGLGERAEEVEDLIKDVRAVGVDIFTAGQYLQPSRHHIPVDRYLQLEEFTHLERLALDSGFSGVAVGPLVRSSYRAQEVAG